MNKNKAFATIAGTIFLTALSLVGGCGNKASDTAVAPPVSQKGVAPVVPTTGATPTPEQEAAKQKAIQEGPAMSAAMDPHQTGQTAPK